MISLRFSCLLCLLVGGLLSAASGERIGVYQHGTIIRMRMAECLPDHGIVSALAGNGGPQSQGLCPEYTLLADKVVYVMVGRPSRDVLPLAETVDFRIRKNEIAVRIDDAKREVRFMVREMVLRAEWEHQRDGKEPLHGVRRFEMPMLRSD